MDIDWSTYCIHLGSEFRRLVHVFALSMYTYYTVKFRRFEVLGTRVIIGIISCSNYRQVDLNVLNPLNDSFSFSLINICSVCVNKMSVLKTVIQIVDK